MNITLEEAMTSYKMGFIVTFDGDKHRIMIGTNCNRCGEYFEKNGYTVYCDKCKNIKKQETLNSTTQS